MFKIHNKWFHERSEQEKNARKVAFSFVFDGTGV
jgi:hypothetical protein